MAVRLVKSRDLRNIPEFTLWTMIKGQRIREVRMRVPPVGHGFAELALYELRVDGIPNLLWVITLASDVLVNTLAQRMQREYEVEGWTTPCLRCNGAGWVCETHPDSPLEHLRPESASTCDGAGMPCRCEIGQQLEAKLDWTDRTPTE